MATRTASVSGLWSNTATWGGAAIPVNGDAVVINNGVEVPFDVDQSGFANGLLSLQIDGKLIFKHDTVTCLKMNGNITGSGELWVGTEANPIQRPAVGSEYRAYILFNSTGTINIPTIRMYGWYPTKEFTQLSADAASGQAQIVLNEDLGLQAGDIISIGSGAENGVSAEAAIGVYTVNSYNPSTKTVTLSVNLQTARLKDDYVAWVNRPVKIARSSGTTAILVTTPTINNGILKGVHITPKLLAPAGLTYFTGWELSHCTFYRTSAIFAKLGDSIFSNCIFVGAGSSLVKMLYSSNYNIELNNCISMNMDTVGLYNNNVRVNNHISQNDAEPPVGNVFNSIFKNFSSANDAADRDSEHYYYNCIFSGIDSQFLVLANFIARNCIFKSNATGYLGYSFGKLYNCLFEGSNEINFQGDDLRTNLDSIQSFDHNQLPGNYKSWMKGGSIETDFNGEIVLPGRLIFNCESADYPVFRDFQVLLPANRTMTWQALTNKSFTGGTVKIELIDPSNDPLIDPTAAPLATYSLPDQADTNLPLKLGYKSDKAMLAVLRISAQNSTGTVEVDTRLIENRIQMGR